MRLFFFNNVLVGFFRGFFTLVTLVTLRVGLRFGSFRAFGCALADGILYALCDYIIIYKTFEALLHKVFI